MKNNYTAKSKKVAPKPTFEKVMIKGKNKSVTDSILKPKKKP